MEHVPESNTISSVPTIKFYKVPNGTNGPVVPAGEEKEPDVVPEEPEQPKIINLLRNMIAKTQPTPAAQNEVMFQEARTANNMIQFAKQNLAKAVNQVKGKKSKKTVAAKAVATKKRGRPAAAKKNPAVNAGANNSAYNIAKSNDTKVASKLKKGFKKL